jgi:hypothetical protein
MLRASVLVAVLQYKLAEGAQTCAEILTLTVIARATSVLHVRV